MLLNVCAATALMGVERSLGTAPRNPLNVAQYTHLATFNKKGAKAGGFRALKATVLELVFAILPATHKRRIAIKTREVIVFARHFCAIV